MTELLSMSSSDLSITQVNAVVDKVDGHMAYFQEIGQPIIEFYAESLDRLMEKIHRELNQSNLGIQSLQMHFLNLTSEVYRIASNVERIGLLMDLANMNYKDAFNTSLLDYSSQDAKLTVAKLNALADKATLPESVINFIYARTYKILKAKVDAAEEMIRTLSKLLSSKIGGNNQFEDRFDANTKQILLESRNI